MKRYNVSITSSTIASKSKVWFAPVLFLLRVRPGRNAEKIDIALGKGIDGTRRLEEIDRTNGCSNVIWSTSDENYHTVTNDFLTEELVEVGNCKGWSHENHLWLLHPLQEPKQLYTVYYHPFVDSSYILCQWASQNLFGPSKQR